jgi:hypothetical protein
MKSCVTANLIPVHYSNSAGNIILATKKFRLLFERCTWIVAHPRLVMICWTTGGRFRREIAGHPFQPSSVKAQRQFILWSRRHAENFVQRNFNGYGGCAVVVSHHGDGRIL